MFGEGKKGVRVLVVSMMVLVGALLVLSAPALADETPEAPEVTRPAYISTAVVGFEGVLNPGKTGSTPFEANEFFFIYDKSSSQCTGGGSTAVEVSHGGAKEHVELYEGGLEPGTEYTDCLVTRSLVEHKEAVSPPVTFKTREVPVTLNPDPVTATTATLRGTLNPNGAGEPGFYEFKYVASATECEAGEPLETPQPEGEVTGRQGQSVETTVSDLQPATTYAVCLIARNSNLEAPVNGASVTFTTGTTVPEVSEERSPSVGSSTATVGAAIDPNGLSTSYYVEYVSEAQFDASGWSEAGRVPASDAELPAANSPLPVSEKLSGLQSGTAYRYRFVAANSANSPGSVAMGAEATFTSATSHASGTGLPDGRVDELVSTLVPSSGNAGEPYTPVTTSVFDEGGESGALLSSDLPFQAAADGEAVAYAGEPAVSGGTGAINQGLGNQWLAKRTPGGWETEDISPANTSPGTEYQGFTDDLTSAFVEGQETAPLTSGVPIGCAAPYLRSSEGQLTALFPLGVAPVECGKPLFAGESESGSNILFQSEAALTPNSEQATEVPPNALGQGHHGGRNQGESCVFGCNLYDFADGELHLVNVVDGNPVPNATFGGYTSELGANNDFSNDISTDGSRIFWTDTQAEKNGAPNPDFAHVYVLENGTEEAQVSGADPAEYWTATPDGRYAFYTENGELWRFDTSAEPEVEPRKALASKGLHGENAGVLGVIGTNQTGVDGAYVYFVADGVLASNVNANKETAEKGMKEGDPNLYLNHEGTTVFIASLAPQDNNVKPEEGTELEGDWKAYLGARVAAVTPDGRHLIFESLRSLTGYDNNYENEGGSVKESLLEVFTYSADTELLECASCNPSDTPPQIREGRGEEPFSLLPASYQNHTHVPRWLSADGNRVFFDTKQPLLGEDTNGVQDVYEWEREGEGTCTAQAPARPNGGCVYLLTGGTAGVKSYLVDADLSGDNVFFEHVGPLGSVHAPVDHNELYDARVDGGFPETSLACTGTGCQGVPPAPPIFATPASATFAGAGNPPTAVSPKLAVKSLTRKQKLAKALKACKTKPKKKQAACKKQARKRYAVKSRSKKAGNHRRAR